MRLTSVVRLMVEQMSEHLVARLRMRYATGRGVVEGFRETLLVQVVDECDDLLILRAPRSTELPEILVTHLVQSRATRTYPLQTAHPEPVRHEQVVESPEKRPEESAPVFRQRLRRKLCGSGIEALIRPAIVQSEHAEVLLSESHERAPQLGRQTRRDHTLTYPEAP
jgi:hypothetical protein